MKKFQKVLIVLCLVVGTLLTALFSCSSSSGNIEDKSMVVNQFDMNVVIDEFGDMHVKEVYVIDNFTDYYNNYFYKQIAYNKNNMFGNSSVNKSSLVKDVHFVAKDETGVVYDSDVTANKYPTHFAGYSYNNDRDERRDFIRCEQNRADCDMIFYYNNSGFARITTFTYEYIIEGVITQYNDISEFNWVLLDYQPFKFNNITINITLPEGDYNIENEKTFFHGTNMAKREFVDDNKIVIKADDMYSDEQIEVRLLLNNDLFDSVREKNKVSYTALSEILDFEAKQAKDANIKYVVGYIGSIALFVLFLIGLGVMTFVCYKKYDKEFESDFYNEYYRELPGDYPPAVMGYLYKFRSISDEDLTATLLDLIRRKYLILDSNGSSGYNEKNPDYTIKLNKDKSQDDLKGSEKHLIKWFISMIGDGEKVTSKQLSSYCNSYTGAQNYQRDCNSWHKLVESEAKKYNFFDEGIKKAKNKYIISSFLLGFIIVMSLVLLSGYSGYNIGVSFIPGIVLYMVAFVIYVNSFDRRSKMGNEDYVRWKAFKNFLEDFSSFEDYPVPSIIVWEHYLVYATSFGIADKVMEQLKLKFKVENISDVDSTFIVYFGFNHRIGRFHRTVGGMRSMSTATIARHTAQRTSGGFRSGGGGFSGGSSFGGGGGSIGGGRR